MEVSSAQIATIQMDVTINRPPVDVWRALINEIGEWWPDEFYAGGAAGKRNFQLEAKPGGCMYEHWGDEGGVLWGTVVAVDPEKSLQILGHLFPNWGGPCQWYGTWSLRDEGKTTTLNFSETALGNISDSGMQEKDKGWQFLWATLKAHVEDNRAPKWQE